jgi:hypothetical protein
VEVEAWGKAKLWVVVVAGAEVSGEVDVEDKKRKRNSSFLNRLGV